MKYGHGERKVLIVDDEADLRLSIADILTGAGVHCDTASTGLMALEMLKNSSYDAVLCDIGMPEMDGITCFSKAQIQGVVAPFVFITAYNDAEHMLQAVRLGAVDFIPKPFDIKEVVDVTFRAVEIGVRRGQIKKEIELTDPNLLEKVQRESKFISLLLASNNQKRVAKI